MAIRHPSRPIFSRGISLIEVLIAIAIFTLSVASLGVVGLSGMLMAQDGIDRYRGVLAAKEGIAALRSMRAQNFSLLTPGTYGLVFAGGGWQLTPTPDTIDKFTRTVTITSSGAGRLFVDVDITWPLRIGTTGTIHTRTFIHQLFGSKWIQTTETDFIGGKLHGTAVVADGDGAVELESLGDWVKPREFVTYDMPDQGTLAVMAEADGVLYLASSASGAKPLVALDLADAGRGTLSPLLSTDVGASVKAIAISGDYLYLATDGDTRELLVLRRADFSVVQTIDLLGNADALALTATGTRLYLGRAQSTRPELYEFDISAPEGGVPSLQSVESAGSMLALSATSSYLFVGTDMNTSELLVVAMSNLGVMNSLDLSGTADMTDAFISGSTLYMSRGQSAAEEVVRIDISNPLGPLTTNGGAEVAGVVSSLALASDGRLYAATAIAVSEVIAYTLPAFTATAYDVSQGNGASAVAAVGPYVYVGMTNNNPELVALRGGRGQWESPTVQGVVDVPGTSDGVSVATRGDYAYLGTQGNSSGGEFFIINKSDAAMPQLRGSVEVGTSVSGVAMIGSSAYLSTSDNGRELIVVNVADPDNPSIAGFYNTVGTADGAAVAASGTLLALGTKNSTGGTGREVYLFDVATPASPLLQGSFEVGDSVNSVSFSPSGYLMLATANNAKELIVLDVRTPSAPLEVASYNTTGTADALAVVSFNSTGILLTTQNNGASADFYLFTQNPLSGAIIQSGFLDLAANNNGAAVGNDLAFIGSDESGKGLVIVDIANLGAPQRLGTLAFGATVNAVATDGTYAFLATVDNNREFAIATPLTLTPGFVREGWLTSSAFDAGTSGVTWSTLSWNATGTGSVSFQFRSSATEAGLLNAAWVGPQGLRNTSFTTSGTAITTFPDADGVQWIQYRLKEEGDGVTTPSMMDVEIIYN